MPRGRSYRAPAGRKIDFKQWDAAPGLLTSFTGNQSALSGGLSFTQPATLLRFRGYVSAFMGESGATVADRMIMTFGLMIMSTDAFTAGPASLPDPATEPEFPWIWWNELGLHTEVASGAEAWGVQALRIELDSKAMRKIKPGETVALIVQSTNQVGAPVVEVDIGQLRVLIGT